MWFPPKRQPKTYSVDQLLRGRYVLRNKGKVRRQHKLTSKGTLLFDMRTIRQRIYGSRLAFRYMVASPEVFDTN